MRDDEVLAVPETVGSDEQAMGLAIRFALAGVATGQSPFGCCIVRDGHVLACAHNRVWADTDATAHAEVLAIRAACRKLETIDLAGSTLYTTCEPCPMCFAAAHWARVSRVVYGASIADAREAGFNELGIGAGQMRELGPSAVEVVPGFMASDCRNVFTTWSRLGLGKPY